MTRIDCKSNQTVMIKRQRTKKKKSLTTGSVYRAEAVSDLWPCNLFECDVNYYHSLFDVKPFEFERMKNDTPLMYEPLQMARLLMEKCGNLNSNQFYHSVWCFYFCFSLLLSVLKFLVF